MSKVRYRSISLRFATLLSGFQALYAAGAEQSHLKLPAPLAAAIGAMQSAVKRRHWREAMAWLEHGEWIRIDSTRSIGRK